MDSAALGVAIRQTEARLTAIWDEVGQPHEERGAQLSLLVAEMVEIMAKKVGLETAMLEEYREEMRRLMQEIPVEAERVERPDLGRVVEQKHETLTAQLTKLRGQHEQIMAIKAQMLTEIGEVLGEYHGVCKELGVEVDKSFLEPGSKLGKARLEACRERLREVKLAKGNRVKAIQRVVADLQSSFKELGISPETEFDKDIVLRNGESLGIGDSAVEALSRRARELQEEKERRTTLLRNFAKQITGLWDKLGVSTEVRKEFYSKNDGLADHVIQACRAELERLEGLKTEKMAELIEKLHAGLQGLWRELRYSDLETQLEEERISKERKTKEQEKKLDALLEFLEQETERLKATHKITGPMFAAIERYLALTKERDEYDALIQDSSRLLSRKGGSRLQDEEKMRLRVTKELPALVDKLRESIVRYEHETGKLFALNGVPVLTEVLEITENQYKNKKERAKEEKKHRSLTGTNTSVLLSTSTTSASNVSRAPLSQLNRKVGR